MRIGKRKSLPVSLEHSQQNILRLKEFSLRAITLSVDHPWGTFVMWNLRTDLIFTDWLLVKSATRLTREEQMQCRHSNSETHFTMGTLFFWKIQKINFLNSDTRTQFYFCILLVAGLRTMMFPWTQEWDNTKHCLMMELLTQLRPSWLSGHHLCTMVAPPKYFGMPRLVPTVE
jgi:hypothetical protein